MPAHRGSNCFVPNCKSGLKSCKVKVSLFRAPKDPGRLKAWSRMIKRADKDLTRMCVVCERHFEERYVERTFKHTVNGQVVEIDRDRPQLTADAIPTIFPEAPSYFTRRLPKQRKTRNLCQQVVSPPKRKKPKNVPEAADRIIQDETSTPTTSTPQQQQQLEQQEQPPGTSLFYSDLRTPTSHWSKIVFESHPTTVHYAFCEPESDTHVRTTKLVTFSCPSDEAVGVVRCCVYLRGLKISDQEVRTTAEAESELTKAANLAMCFGTELPPLGGSNYVAFGDGYFSKECTGLSVSNGRRCLKCKYLRKLIQNQMSKRRSKQTFGFIEIEVEDEPCQGEYEAVNGTGNNWNAPDT